MYAILYIIELRNRPRFADFRVNLRDGTIGIFPCQRMERRCGLPRSHLPPNRLVDWVGAGAITPRPIVDGDRPILSGGDPLVCLARMDYPSLVDPRCRAF